ncbi:fimbrial protein [Yersinia kristensenii]|uniref:fimbrial protein n=1 Tax=Yersinia kristensenii TaxID=28152 RepID=UPI001643D30A|nr:fimbrial protein [Yersinia kristensenii]MBW5813499.1 fimbrial protein [Yersinia kristensenii]MBW5817313.1 fimbrial protein [Yersinia kristensenii]MBW5830800.1 fimbrial protein [Yersinia kristensenii]MBW5842781.1 fimbrial protein [Yersinia kristensenii]MDA5490102.1 fimbrial protein [Yersinia kristensenii]
MNMIKIAAILLLLPWQAASEGIPIHLGDIEVKLDVTAQPIIEVEKPQGGWYDNIKLHPSLENHKIYQSEVPITVKLRRQEGFRISVKNPLILIRQTNNSGAPEVAFSPAEIRWGRDRATLRPLSAIPEIFIMDKRTTHLVGTDYILQISALAPNGPDIAGKYHGQLTLIFETNS